MTTLSSITPSNDTGTSEADKGILEELSRILASSQFTGTSRSKRFLDYIVKETLSGRGDDIKGYTLALDVFDKSSNFDSNQNTIVRVQASQVRRRLKLYYADNTDDTGVQISLPIGRYKPVFLTDITQPVSEQILNGFQGRNHTPKLDYPILQIQPLRNHSEEETYQSFTDSVTTELIHKISELDIFHVKHGDPNPIHIDLGENGDSQDHDGNILAHIETQKQGADAGPLQDTYILSGSIRRRDLNVRVTVLLSTKIEATYVKTHAFEEAFTTENIFSAPETLAAEIVRFIGAN